LLAEYILLLGRCNQAALMAVSAHDASYYYVFQSPLLGHLELNGCRPNTVATAALISWNGHNRRDYLLGSKLD
jgi:hypothetical protein